ncbi:hypothetical protein SAMN02745824_0106 [Parasphingorhabdus marina DSM 22363]|uniref:Lipoprotein n=1 Tax=Parasphingorhabdus marina DSM 22363 TaxID=1123272 RepID=A0A1N6CLX4_9SPHN|nr:hypothetical protein [Parasphingorhabdus marina]SIN59578.1 hypothetical protein SAMN02745824_0106 [Parasphingorhabdus marina DSM 22363]
MKQLGFSVLFLLAACGSAEKLVQTAESPDGSMSANFYTTNLGACCSMHSRIELTYTNWKSERVTEEVYRSSGGSPVKIEWLDNWNLLVTDCDAAKIEMKSSISTHKSSEHDYRRLHLISAYSRNGSVNGIPYCERHDIREDWRP